MAREQCPMTTLPRAHLVQTDIAWENPRANYQLVDAMLDACADIRPGDFVLLPELFDTGFSFRLEVTVDRDNQTLNWIRSTAKRLGVTLHGSRTVMGAEGQGRNRATIAGPDGGVLCEYDKIHPFSFGRETEFFIGGEAIATFPWKHTGDSALVCPAICYDLRFPELFRMGMQRGAEVFALGANWPDTRRAHRLTLARARAIENQAYMFCVNRAGSDPHLAYLGGTAAFGPKGEELGLLGDGPGILSVDVDLTALRKWRQDFPACRDARLI